jgi:rod shape determining protein RodA
MPLDRTSDHTLLYKLRAIRRSYVLLILALGTIGCLGMYSAANGSWEPWARPQAIRFAVCTVMMLGMALVDVRFYLKQAYLLYGGVLVLLVAVLVAGHTGKGAERWLNVGPLQLQPSELMKITLTLALARYFQGVAIEDIGRPRVLLIPLGLIFLPVLLVLKEPNLGTSMILIALGGTTFFLAGVRLWKFGLVLGSVLGAVPVIWQFMHDYQKQRVTTFMNPESDPRGAGYHIMQSKIALGSGGLWGKGFMGGTQSQLNFLPEKHTDFIFTLLAEEWGMVGALALLGLYVLVVAYGFVIGLSCRNQFGRIVAMTLSVNLFLYVFINMAMVMGLIPVVGVPLALISYGGTSMLATMLGFGIILSVLVHRDVRLGRRWPYDVV